MKSWKRVAFIVSITAILSSICFSQATFGVANLETSNIRANKYPEDIPKEIFDNFNQTVSVHINHITSINNYVSEYIENKGRINWRFRLPKDLKENFNNIIDEFNAGIGDTSFDPDEYGKNDLIILPYILFKPIDFGIVYRFWTNYLFTQLIAEYMPLGVAVIAAIIDVALENKCSEKFLFLVASFIDTLSGITPEEIYETDEGKGVRWDFLDSFLITRPAVIDILDLFSQ